MMKVANTSVAPDPLAKVQAERAAIIAKGTGCTDEEDARCDALHDILVTQRCANLSDAAAKLEFLLGPDGIVAGPGPHDAPILRDVLRTIRAAAA